MNQRQEIAYRNPIRRGPEIFECMYHRDIEREGLCLSTTLTVSCFPAYPEESPVWTASIAILGSTMQPLRTCRISERHRRMAWKVLDGLLEGVGEGETERILGETAFLVSRRFRAEEQRGIAEDGPFPRDLWEAMRC